MSSDYKSDDMEVLQFFKSCRALIATKNPYFSAALFSLKFRIAKNNAPPYAAIDCRGNVYINKDYYLPLCRRASAQDIKETCFVIYHEMSHFIRMHFARRPAIDNKIWNVVTDLEINDKPIDGTAYPTKNGVTAILLPSQFGFPDGLLAEDYLELMKKNGYANGLPNDDATKNSVNNSGSGSDGIKREWEDVSDSDEVNPQIVAKQTAEQIKDYAKDPKFAGNIPASWKRWAEFSESVIEWPKLLRRYLRVKVGNLFSKSDYSFSRPNRRYSSSDFIFPSIRARCGLSVSIVIDTSGSMSPDKLAKALAESVEILDFVGSIDVIYCDAEVTNVLQISKKGKSLDYQKMADNILGGGGTDMSPGIRYAINEKKSDLVVVFTDGILNYPDKFWGRKNDVFWVILSSGDHSLPPKEYGREMEGFVVLYTGS